MRAHRLRLFFITSPMRSIERRFQEYQRRRPSHSSLVNFAAAVRGQAFSKDAMSRWFNKLVERDDYERSDKRLVLRHLVSVSTLEDNGKRA